MKNDKTKKYFIISDVHGFCKEMKQGLFRAGFRKNNPNHILVVLGDVFDRGDEAVKVFKYITSIPKKRRILVKGNHEYLYLDLLKKEFPERHDYSNGTVATFYQIAQASIEEDFKTVRDKVASGKVTKWLKSKEWLNYYELDDTFILVHSFIPDVPDWREKATEFDFEKASWGCPWEQYLNGKFDEEKVKGKILVCGHWHTSDFYYHLAGINDPEIDKIYYNKDGHLIAIDGGVRRNYWGELIHHQNVLKL